MGVVKCTPCRTFPCAALSSLMGFDKMGVSMLRYALSLILPFLLFGCATNPPQLDSRHDFSLKPDDSHGRLVIQPFQVSVTEPGVTFFHVLAAMGGADLDAPFWANAYDVTDDEIRPLGGFKYAKGQTVSLGVVEQLLPAGHRILMLDRSFSIEPDFIEVNIHPKENTLVALGRSGFAENAFITELEIRKGDYAFCEGLRVPVKTRDGFGYEVYPLLEGKTKLVEDYMEKNHVDPGAEYFKRFCLLQTYPIYVNEVNVQEFEKSKADIVAMKEKYLSKWLASNDKKVPFNFRRDGIPHHEPCSSEVRICPNGEKIMRTAKNCEFAACGIEHE